MNAATRRTARQPTLHDENRVQHTRVTRSKLASTEIVTTTTLPSKVGNNSKATNATAPNRKRAALGDVTNAHKKSALGDITNAVAKSNTEKPTVAGTKRPLSRKPSVVVKEPTESKPHASKQVSANIHNTTNTSTVIPKKRPSENTAPRRTLTQSASTANLVQKNNVRPTLRRRAEEAPEPEAPRKKQKVEKQQDWEDLDAADVHDPLMVSEYVVEIFDYMHELEIKTMPNPTYMSKQEALEWRMRGILVDWLIEVHAKFRLLPETLFLCVNIIDRFLSMRQIGIEKLQLVGVTALLVASKYEEIISPAIAAFIYVADGGYTEEEIKKAERYLLAVIGFDLSYPNPMNFLRRISKADDYNIHTRTIAKYLIEISLVDDRFLKYPPSIVAAAAMYLARKMTDRGPWNANLVHYSGYSSPEIRPVVRLMIDYLARREILHEAFFRKYAAKKYMKASIVVREWIRKQYAELHIAPLTPETKVDDDETRPEYDDDGNENDDEDGEDSNDDENRDDASEEDDYLYANELEEHEIDG